MRTKNSISRWIPAAIWSDWVERLLPRKAALEGIDGRRQVPTRIPHYYNVSSSLCVTKLPQGVDQTLGVSSGVATVRRGTGTLSNAGLGLYSQDTEVAAHLRLIRLIVAFPDSIRELGSHSAVVQQFAILSPRER